MVKGKYRLVASRQDGWLCRGHQEPEMLPLSLLQQAQEGIRTIGLGYVGFAGRCVRKDTRRQSGAKVSLSINMLVLNRHWCT